MLDKDLRELLALFRSKGVEFLVVGGHAVAFHGRPRLTEDLDLFVRPDTANGERIVQALLEFGFGSLELTATDFQAGVTVHCADRAADGRSPMEMLMLVATQGSKVRFVADGADAEQLVDALVSLVASGFGEM